MAGVGLNVALRSSLDRKDQGLHSFELVEQVPQGQPVGINVVCVGRYELLDVDSKGKDELL